MLTGRFGDTSGRPYIEGRLVLPRLGLQADISFLIDTGADTSLLHPTDGKVLGIDYSKLTGKDESIGVGGVCYNYLEEAMLLFTEPGKRLYVYTLDLAISPNSPDIMDLPSLLGRDILDQWGMTYRPKKKQLSFTVLTSDLEIDLTAP